MVKKRRDKERDPSSAKKVAKLGGTALAVGAGAVLFNRSNIGMKMHSEIMPALSKAHKGIRNDLKGKKLSAKLIDDAYKNNIGIKGEKIKALAKESGVRRTITQPDGTERTVGQQLKFNIDRNNNLFGRLKNAEQISRNVIITDIKEVYKNNLKDDITKMLALRYDNKKASQIRQIVDNSFDKVDDISHNDLFSGEFLKKTFKEFNFNAAEREDVLNFIKQTKEREMDPNKINSFIEKQSDFIKQVKTELLKPERLGAKENKFFDKLTNSKALTFRDLEIALEKDPNLIDPTSIKTTIQDFKSTSRSKRYELDLLSELRELNHDGSLDDVIVDKTLRMRGDQIYSTKTFNDALFDTLNYSASTLPGRLVKGIDLIQQATNPSYAFSFANKLDIASSFDSSINRELIRNKAIIGKDLFDITMDLDGAMRLSNNPLDSGGIMMSMMHGSGARLVSDMLGTNRELMGISKNPLKKLLDIEQDGTPDIFRRAKAFLGKGQSDEWERNVLINMRDTFKSYDDLNAKLQSRANQIAQKAAKNGEVISSDQARIQAMSSIFNDSKSTSHILDKFTAENTISDATINKLLEGGLSSRSKALLKAVRDYDDAGDMIREVLENSEINSTSLSNLELDSLANRYLRNSDDFSKMLKISNTDSINIPFMDISLSHTNVLSAEDVLRREIVKEVMLDETADNLNNMFRIIQSSGLSDAESQSLRFLTNWGYLQKNTGISSKIDDGLKLESIYGEFGTLKDFEEHLSINGVFKDQFIDMFDTLKEDYTFLHKGNIGNFTEQYASEFNKYTYVKKSVASDILKDLNNTTKTLANLKQFGKELIAGRDDLENYTVASMFVQNSVARLIYGVQEFGLGFSAKSTGSSLDMVKNIALKRVLPVMAAYSLYDYLNYEAENFTGVSITGAAANALSTADIALRKAAYSTGIGQGLDWLKESSVIGEYWTGSNEFQDAEERKDWLMNGYSPVRSGRFWGFGSASEYRGSGIQYFQQSYLKRAHSNYNEVGVYGSAEEKFKHSWLPSLRHPLSPLRAALDPYWLEKKNMEDRPYPLTGKMFTEGTPWGAVLNPTIGEILKPVRMLPEVKHRLGKDGRDAKAVIAHLNNKIKARARENDDLILVNGTDIRNAEYTPYGNPGGDELNVTFNNGSAYAKGINYMAQAPDMREYLNVMPNGEITVNDDYGQGKIEMPNKFEQSIYNVTNELSPELNNQVRDIVESINVGIKTLGGRRRLFNNSYLQKSGMIGSALPDRTQGTYTYKNLVSSNNTYLADYYSSMDRNMISSGNMYDYGQDALHSAKQLSGIYGFLNDQIFGEQSYTFRYEHAGNMSSFSRNFWDSGTGGLGGGVMEIARRFFPSEDRSRININPLTNSMPDWMPDRFKTGDPYTALPKGEMRMPGRGYETLNELHPDEFGEYGAFDRMKILGDVAPTSQEYKIWRNIARNTVTDPELIKQIEEIEYRAEKMSSKHDFYEYRYVKNNTAYNKGVVKSVNEDGTVTLASGENLSLAGIIMGSGENATTSIYDLLSAGDQITYRTSKDAIRRLEDGLTTSAVIYKDDPMPFSSMNINKMLVDGGAATKDTKNKTALGHLSTISAGQEVLGAAQELLTHARIPILHNKLFKIETALESFKSEQIYGSSFSTWDHPIRGFVMPMLNETFAQSPVEHLAAIGATALHFGFGKKTDSKIIKSATRLAMVTANPATMLGGGLAFAQKLNFGGDVFDKGAKLGAVVGTVGWGLANADNPIKATTSFAVAGATAAKYLKMDEVWGIGGKKGAAIGAAIGFGISALKNPDFDKDKMFGKWLPKTTRKRHELDEYFDRLEYIKYEGLYKNAAFRASIFEGSNIKHIFKQLDKNKKKLAKLKQKAQEVSNKYIAGSYQYNEAMAEIQQQQRALEESQKQAFTGGKYTKAAIAYKKAAESTIYGLSETATPDEILAAIPDQYKDHFKSFMDETSKSKRKEILKYVPDYLKRPLQIAWNEKPSKVKKNGSYFRNKKLPGVAWKGWKPNINMKHVKMKTIENEGMLLSDFGFYESEKSKAGYHLAPDIDSYEGGSGIGYRANMLGALNGLGVSVSNISLEQTSAPGLWIVGDIKQTASDVKKTTEYALGSGMQSVISSLF